MWTFPVHYSACVVVKWIKEKDWTTRETFTDTFYDILFMDTLSCTSEDEGADYWWRKQARTQEMLGVFYGLSETERAIIEERAQQ